MSAAQVPLPFAAMNGPKARRSGAGTPASDYWTPRPSAAAAPTDGLLRVNVDLGLVGPAPSAADGAGPSSLGLGGAAATAGAATIVNGQTLRGGGYEADAEGPAKTLMKNDKAPCFFGAALEGAAPGATSPASLTIAPSGVTPLAMLARIAALTRVQGRPAESQDAEDVGAASAPAELKKGRKSPARDRSRKRRPRPKVDGPAERKRARRPASGSRAKSDGGDVSSRNVTSKYTGVSWDKARKKWVARKREKGKKVYLGYYADEEAAARAVTEYVERGVVALPGRGGVTSEHTGVSWNKALNKWVAQQRENGKKVHLGYYVDEEDAARAVAAYVERGIIPRSKRVGVTSEHTGVSWNKKAKKWVARKGEKGKVVYLGDYTD